MIKKAILIGLFLLISTSVCAIEEIAEWSEESLPVLNDILRKMQTDSIIKVVYSIPTSAEKNGALRIYSSGTTLRWYQYSNGQWNYIPWEATTGQMILDGSIDITGDSSGYFKADGANGMWLGATGWAASPFRVNTDGDMWATSATITGAITATSGAIGNWNVIENHLYSLASGTPTSSPNDGLVLYSTNPSIICYEDAAKRLEIGYLSSGVYGIKGYDGDGGDAIFEISDAAALIGGCSITATTIGSTTFASGPLGAGWQISNNGQAEFNNVRVRGKISGATFEKDTISSIGGSFVVMDSDVLDVDMTALDASTLTISGDTTFSVGDMLRIKDGVDDEWLEVTNVGSAPEYTVTRDKNSDYTADTNPIWKDGTTVVNYGASGEGYVFMTASETNAPFIDIATHAGEPWDTTTTRLRMGNLNGFLGYSSDVYGIAIGEATKYLKYDPTNGLRIAGNTLLGQLDISTGGYISSGQTAYDTGTGYWLEYNTGTPRFSLGNAAGNKILWDGTNLNIVGGLSTASSGARVDILPDANTGIVIYDNQGTPAKVFEALVGGDDVGDVTLGSDTSYVKWDKSEGVLLCANLESPDYVADTTGWKLSSATGLEVNVAEGLFFVKTAFNRFGGNGEDGAKTISASGNFSSHDGSVAGIAQYTSLNINSGTLTVDTDYMIIGVTGDCHIHGTISAIGATGSGSGTTGEGPPGDNALGGPGISSYAFGLGGGGGGGGNSISTVYQGGGDGGGGGGSGGVGAASGAGVAIDGGAGSAASTLQKKLHSRKYKKFRF